MSNRVPCRSASGARRIVAATLLTLCAFAGAQSVLAQDANRAAHSAQVADFLKSHRPFNLNAAAPNVLLEASYILM